MAVIPNAAIGFYRLVRKDADRTKFGERARVPDAGDPRLPACRQLQNRGILINEMIELGTFFTEQDT